VSSVDQARWVAALQRYEKLTADTHPVGLDALLPKSQDVASLFSQSTLMKTDARLSWMDKSSTDIEKSDDAFLQLAVKIFPIADQIEQQRKELDGNLERVIPKYMAAFIDWKNPKVSQCIQMQIPLYA